MVQMNSNQPGMEDRMSNNNIMDTINISDITTTGENLENPYKFYLFAKLKLDLLAYAVMFLHTHPVHNEIPGPRTHF